MKMWGITNTGLVRSENQDAYAAFTVGGYSAAVVCDGMGGTNFEKLITLGTPEAIEAYLSQIPPDKTIPEQWAISTTKAVASFCLTSTVSPKRSSRWAKAPMWQRSWW